MKGIIIGGGIAGLMAAIALQQVGIEAEVYEAAPEIKPLGAGISMAPNAMVMLQRLGLADEVQRVGMTMEHLAVTDERFKPIQSIEQEPLKARYGFATTNLHRAALHQVLLAPVAGQVHLGKRFVKAEQHAAGITAHFEDGTNATGTFLIGADGIHSKVRQQILPSVQYRYSGQTSWRGIVPFCLPDEYLSQSIEAFGGKHRFGFTAVSPREVYWYAVATAPASRLVPKEQAREHLRERFGYFHPLVGQLIAATPMGQLLQTDMYDFITPDRWHQGNICLIGDAAHATTPNMGQGGCQAIEDAWYLAQALQRHARPEAAFAFFTRQRLAKVRYIVNNSYTLGKLAHTETARHLLYFLMRRMPASISRKQLERVYGV